MVFWVKTQTNRDIQAEISLAASLTYVRIKYIKIEMRLWTMCCWKIIESSVIVISLLYSLKALNIRTNSNIAEKNNRSSMHFPTRTKKNN